MNAATSRYESDRLHAAKIGVLLLSLDAVVAHAEPLGFGFDWPEQVMRAARACAARWKNPRANSAGSYPALTAAFADALERTGNLVDVEKVARWLDRFAFAIAAGSVADGWGVLLTCYNAAHASALGKRGLRAESVDMLRRVAAEYRVHARAIDDLEEKIRSALTLPWDRAHFAQYQSESELISPTDYLWGWLQLDAVLAALDVVLSRLDDDELHGFSVWASAVAEVDAHIPPARFSVDVVRQLVADYKELAHPHAR